MRGSSQTLIGEEEEGEFSANESFLRRLLACQLPPPKSIAQLAIQQGEPQFPPLPPHSGWGDTVQFRYITYVQVLLRIQHYFINI